MNIKDTRVQQKAIMMYKIVNGIAPCYLLEIFKCSDGKYDYSFRRSDLNLELPKNKSDHYNSIFAFTGAKL